MMNRSSRTSRRSQQPVCSLAGSVLLTVGFAASAHAADYLNLPIVNPVISCDKLAAIELSKGELSKAAGAAVTITSATVLDTPKGKFCKVLGTVQSPIGFEVDLPMEHWTQRYAQGPQGQIVIGRAGSNMPAVNGEFVLATDDKGGPGIARVSVWTADNQQKRIDWAYRGNHETALVAKALIKAFYGQKPRFSY